MKDTINALFESSSCIFIGMSILKLHKDKQVKGVDWKHIIFFVVWGFWNMYYYPSLGQWKSFFGGVLITIFNSIWVMQILYYSGKR